MRFDLITSAPLRVERLFTMKRILKKSIWHEMLWAVLLAFLAYGFVPATALAHDGKIWLDYSQAQRRQALAGFVHCYRMDTSSNVAFVNVDVSAAVKNIDKIAVSMDSRIANIILQALKNAPAVK